MQEMQKMWVLSLGQENALKKKMAPTPAFLPGKSHEQRGQQAIVHGVAELDMAEQVSVHRCHCWVETAMVHAYCLVLASVAGFLYFI